MEDLTITELIQKERKNFDNKQLIKPWLQSKLTIRGINIVIERSDESKIVFKCKCNSQLNNDELLNFKKKNPNQDLILQRKNIRDFKKKFNCPFRIRANYSYRLKNWSLVVVNENHNHQLFPINSSSPLSSQINSPINSNYNYSSRLPSLPNSNFKKTIPATTPNLNNKNLNELQLEFNNNLLRLNCLNKEDEIKLIYLKLLKVLNDEQKNNSLITNISSNFGSLFKSSLTNKTVLPSLQETLKYQQNERINGNVSNGDNAYLTF